MMDGEERRPEGGEGAGANWRTMMATFVTRLEREHEALLEALRERLDGAEARSRRLEERVARLEERLAAVEGSGADGGPAPAREEGRPGEGDARAEAAPHPPEPAATSARPAASALAAAPMAEGGAGAEETPAVAAPAAAAVRPPGQEAAEAILRREAEVLRRAAAGESALAIAAALGRSVGEVELVLHLARRASGGEGWPGRAGDVRPEGSGLEVRSLGPAR
jgi:hypothetical protein